MWLQVANVCYLGFAAPPEGPRVPLYIFDRQGQTTDQIDINNPTTCALFSALPLLSETGCPSHSVLDLGVPQGFPVLPWYPLLHMHVAAAVKNVGVLSTFSGLWPCIVTETPT